MKKLLMVGLVLVTGSSVFAQKPVGVVPGVDYTSLLDANRKGEIVQVSQKKMLFIAKVGTNSITFTIGTRAAKLNGKAMKLKAAPFYWETRYPLWVPTELLEKLGCKIGAGMALRPLECPTGKVNIEVKQW